MCNDRGWLGAACRCALNGGGITGPLIWFDIPLDRPDGIVWLFIKQAPFTGPSIVHLPSPPLLFLPSLHIHFLCRVLTWLYFLCRVLTWFHFTGFIVLGEPAGCHASLSSLLFPFFPLLSSLLSPLSHFHLLCFSYYDYIIKTRLRYSSSDCL